MKGPTTEFKTANTLATCLWTRPRVGSEADVTIVSLVRNNDHNNIRSALGFLADFRRMNVLLSRAKWRLILVGSFDFLEEVLNSARIAGNSEPIEFLGSLFDSFDNADDATIVRQPLAKLEGAP